MSSSQDSGGKVAASSSDAVAGASSSAASAVRTPKSPKSPKTVPRALADKPAGLPPGKYKLVGWDIDTTGRRLIDEVLKSKTEIAALIDFLNWLESIKAGQEMIILIYHEPRRLNPTVLIQSLIRQRLFDRFKKIVAGFTDSYYFCADKCKGFESVSLQKLAELLLDEDESNTDTTLDRATAAYNIVEQLANQGGDYLDVEAGGEAASLTGPSKEMLEVAREFARPISTELEAFESLKDLLEKQNSFRAAFMPLLRAPGTDQRRVTQLRRSLADAGLLYEQVKDAWHDGRRAGLENIMVPLEATLEPEDIQVLVDLFNRYFLLEKEPKFSRPSSRLLTDDSDELYLSSDSDSSGQLSPSLRSSSGMAATFLGVDDDEEYDLDF